MLLCALQERYTFKYFLGDLVKKAKPNGKSDSKSNDNNSGGSGESSAAKVEKTKDVEFQEAVRDLKISWIGKFVITLALVFTHSIFMYRY